MTDLPAGGVPTAVGDAAAKKLERMALLEAERKAEVARRKEAAKAEQDPRESVDAFLAKEKEQRALWQAAFEKVPSDGLHPEEAKPLLDELSAQLQGMEAAAAEASYFLPAYDQRSIATTHREMQQQLTDLRAKAVPKKKFSFGSARRKKGADIAAEAAAAQAAAAAKAAEECSTSDTSPPAPTPPQPGRGLMGLRNCTVVVSDDALAGSDYALIDLEDCDIFLLGRTSAVRCHRLTRCKVHLGPVSGSAFLDVITDCVLHLPAHQVRIHTATNTDFYVRVRSNPIIEHSSGLRFAPTFFDSWPGAAPMLAEAKLSAEDKEVVGKWQKVDDFGWLRAIQSPNWCIMPEDQRADAASPPEGITFGDDGMYVHQK